MMIRPHLRVRKTIAVAILQIFFGMATMRAQPPCPHVHKVAPGDSLAALADYYFGSGDYWSAIMLATNSRAQDFSFISDPQNISNNQSVCIPDVQEAERERNRYATYLQAVSTMTLAEPSEQTKDLVTVSEDQPVYVATWIRAGQLSKYKDRAPQDIWVTVEPHLRNFCSAYLKSHGDDEDELTLRLEERLGLPPSAGKTTFVRIKLDNPNSKTLFRPCSDPSAQVAHCEANAPSEASDPGYAAWFYRQYYFSYGSAKPSPYPWTSLGYTFDWAPRLEAPGGRSFVRFGESEFVIPAGTPIQVLGSEDTAHYCQAQ